MSAPPPPLIVSTEDKRLYRVFRLPNSLRALVCSDPDTDKAAAALDLNVGHYCDPEDIPGLAHFLEHMLFLGTDKYPDEKEYGAFISANGGYTNAWTGSENTNYHFNVNWPHLEPALDRFAQFFISPLFTASATDREMQAVDSEHAKNVQNDMWRMMELFRSTVSPSHPMHKFGTGNLETLKAQADIRDRLLAFHAAHYSANLMTLVVYGRESLDELEKLVRDKFSAVVNKQLPVPAFSGQPLTQKELALRQNVAPIKEVRKLSLCWPIPPQRALWRSRPAGLVSHLIGHEGAGSLLAVLKKRSWANELTAGASDGSA